MFAIAAPQCHQFLASVSLQFFFVWNYTGISIIQLNGTHKTLIKLLTQFHLSQHHLKIIFQVLEQRHFDKLSQLISSINFIANEIRRRMTSVAHRLADICPKWSRNTFWSTFRWPVQAQMQVQFKTTLKFIVDESLKSNLIKDSTKVEVHC